LKCHIGVPAKERENSQILRAHLKLKVAPFPQDDELGGTVNYQEVADGVRDLAASRERKLIETLAQDIAAYVLSHFEVKSIRVELEKFILPETDWVGVVIQRKRN